MVQVHLAHHRAHARDGQLHDAAYQIINLVYGLDRVSDLPVDDRVNVDRHVIARDDRLRRQIDILLAQID